MPLKTKTKKSVKTGPIKGYGAVVVDKKEIMASDAHFVPVEINPVKPPYETGLDFATFKALKDRVSELEYDLMRIVDLIVHGDIDSAKFKEILTKRQGTKA